jgi:hypothetical protein
LKKLHLFLPLYKLFIILFINLINNFMATCKNNTLYFARPSSDSTTCTNKTNFNLGVSDPLDIGQLSPRPNRTKVKSQLRDYILLMLGAPVVTVELDDQQLDAAVDLSLQIYEEYAPREFFKYHVFPTIPGKSVYTLPPDIGYVRHVFYKEMATFSFSSSDLGGAIPIEYFYPGGAYASITGGLIDSVTPIWGRVGEWSLYKGYERTYARSASNLGGWEWVGGYQNIKLYPIPRSVQGVIVHYVQKNTDWQRVNQAMQEGALAHAKIMLGRIRSKFGSLPGAQGGVQLDGKDLITEGLQEKKDWEERLISRYGDTLPITFG